MSDKTQEQSQQSEIQLRFIQMIKDRLPSKNMLVDEIAEILGISYDSAYRRIRGEKSMSIDEVVQLSQVYGISLESLGSAGTDIITFSFRTLDNKTFTFRQYIESQIQQFAIMHKAKEKELIYAAKDMPVYQYYNIPELTLFKIFVWKKSVMGLEEYEDKKFSLTDEDGGDIALCQQALGSYLKIPCIEVWNEETVNSTLRQIQVYSQMGIFQKKNEALQLLDLFESLIEHIGKQAASGLKYRLGETPEMALSSYQLYNNEVLLCDNSIFVKMDGQKVAYLTHNTLNYMHIINREYCEVTFKWMNNLIKRSTMISGAAEKERKLFITGIKDKINAVRAKIS